MTIERSYCVICKMEHPIHPDREGVASLFTWEETNQRIKNLERSITAMQRERDQLLYWRSILSIDR